MNLVRILPYVLLRNSLFYLIDEETVVPLTTYKESGLLTNQNFLEETSDKGTFGYRGELVLIEGEAGDAKGHVKPPVEVARGMVLLADEKLKLVIGAIDNLESIKVFVEKYKADFADNIKIVFFVVDIKEPMQVEIEGANYIFIPLVQGVPWNEMIDELALEKSDFKGQTPADKILTLYSEMQSYKPEYETVSLDEALASTEDIKREAWGAI